MARVLRRVDCVGNGRPGGHSRRAYRPVRPRRRPSTAAARLVSPLQRHALFISFSSHYSIVLSNHYCETWIDINLLPLFESLSLDDFWAIFMSKDCMNRKAFAPLNALAVRVVNAQQKAECQRVSEGTAERRCALRRLDASGVSVLVALHSLAHLSTVTNCSDRWLIYSVHST